LYGAVKNHYELFGVDAAADVEDIKRAFRREIAKYHPDKVTHLAVEFQEMAALRASELTAAYKVLTDAELRAEYDAALRFGRGDFASSPPPASRPPQQARYEPPPPQPAADPSRETPAADAAGETRRRGFEEDRVGKDDIVRRAFLFKLHEVLRNVMGDCDKPALRGFDIACVPRQKQGTSKLFNRTTITTVLVRLVTKVDGEAVTVAYRQAHHARIESESDTVILLLVGNQLASGSEMARALEATRRELPRSLDKIFLVPVDGRDWTAKIPLNAPQLVRTLVERLKRTA
jgi:hypothetical protein